MAFSCCMSVDPGFFAEALKRRSAPEDRLVSDSVQNGGMVDRARQARQKRGPKRDGQGCNRRVVNPALDGPSELIELRKERAERPAHWRGRDRSRRRAAMFALAARA